MRHGGLLSAGSEPLPRAAGPDDAVDDGKPRWMTPTATSTVTKGDACAAHRLTDRGCPLPARSAESSTGDRPDRTPPARFRIRLVVRTTKGDAMDDAGAERGAREGPFASMRPPTGLSTQLPTPLPVECLACYVWRVLGDHGCNATLRWARRWRDARASRATALEQRLARQGGCCDCQLFLNVWATSGSAIHPETMVLDYRPPGDVCRGVRQGSARPCTHWRVRRP